MPRRRRIRSALTSQQSAHCRTENTIATNDQYRTVLHRPRPKPRGLGTASVNKHVRNPTRFQPVLCQQFLVVSIKMDEFIFQ